MLSIKVVKESGVLKLMMNIVKRSFTLKEIKSILNNKDKLSESQLNSFRIILDNINSINIQLVKVGGKYYIINGVHRVKAVIDKLSDNEMIDCDVLVVS